MDASKRQVIEATCRRVVENLKKNNMEACYLPSVSAAPEQVASWLHEGDTVAVGGSMTLAESGVMSLLKSGKYRFLDRYAPGLTRRKPAVFLSRVLPPTPISAPPTPLH